jgi:hypothetical protein
MNDDDDFPLDLLAGYPAKRNLTFRIHHNILNVIR